MPSIPFTLDALAGLALGAVLALVCLRDLSRGVLWYIALAWIPIFHVATLSGSEFVTGLHLVEWLASVLIAVWALRRPQGRLPVLVATPFNAPLFWLLPVAALSLVAGYLGLDPLVDDQRAKLPVSLGQIALFAWPIGVYVVVASSLRTPQAVTRAAQLMTLLALPAMALPFLPFEWRRWYTEWPVYFAVAVSPYCFALSLRAKSMTRRAALLAIAAAPALYGLTAGKALWYVVPTIGCAVVGTLRARRSLVAVGLLAVGFYFLVFVPITGSWLPQKVQGAIAHEEAQQSLGGRTGRAALAADAIGIWSGHPLLGVGPGNNYPYMLRYSVLGTPHGQYVNILLELGAVGLAFYLAFVAMAIRTGLRLLKSVTRLDHETIVLGWLGLFVGLVVVGGLLGDFTIPSIRNDGLHTLSRYYQQWIWLGLLSAVKRIEGL